MVLYLFLFTKNAFALGCGVDSWFLFWYPNKPALWCKCMVCIFSFFAAMNVLWMFERQWSWVPCTIVISPVSCTKNTGGDNKRWEKLFVIFRLLPVLHLEFGFIFLLTRLSLLTVFDKSILVSCPCNSDLEWCTPRATEQMTIAGWMLSGRMMAIKRCKRPHASVSDWRVWSSWLGSASVRRGLKHFRAFPVNALQSRGYIIFCTSILMNSVPKNGKHCTAMVQCPFL